MRQTINTVSKRLTATGSAKVLTKILNFDSSIKFGQTLLQC